MRSEHIASLILTIHMSLSCQRCLTPEMRTRGESTTSLMTKSLEMFTFDYKADFERGELHVYVLAL